jgi:hypothetical protein
MNRCDWADCTEMGILDGVEMSLLNNEGRKNILLSESPSRFIYLCEKHFELGVGQLTSDKE